VFNSLGNRRTGGRDKKPKGGSMIPAIEAILASARYTREKTKRDLNRDKILKIVYREGKPKIERADEASEGEKQLGLRDLGLICLRYL
jgi:ArsR family metal-binding transcriptional regulator